MNRINNFIKEHKTRFIIHSILILLDIIATIILGYIVVNILIAISFYLIYFKLHLKNTADVRRSENNAYGSAQFLIDERNKHVKASQIKKLDQQYQILGLVEY